MIPGLKLKSRIFGESERATMADVKIFQFQPFSSFVSPTFWHKLAEVKIDVDRLSDARRPINASYTNSDVTHCILETDATSFNRFV